MIDIYAQFREQAEHISVTPSTAAWDRIEAKLQMHRSQRKLITARLLSIAASVILLIALSTIAIVYSQNQKTMNDRTYSMTIEALPASTDHGESMFDVEKIRKSYADLSLTHN